MNKIKLNKNIHLNSIVERENEMYMYSNDIAIESDQIRSDQIRSDQIRFIYYLTHVFVLVEKINEMKNQIRLDYIR